MLKFKNFQVTISVVGSHEPLKVIDFESEEAAQQYISNYQGPPAWLALLKTLV